MIPLLLFALAAPPVLTRGSAVTQALAHSPEVRMASAQVELAVAARSEAGFLEPSNPVLEAVISSDRPFAGASG